MLTGEGRSLIMGHSATVKYNWLSRTGQSNYILNEI